ncbi:hypothetical protein MKZ38_000058 [Zalerion maritima]|uniref:DUF7732 domain-containing protein n=1 Tax=Zalerion maritima TaxID=339359 RepID=A0AAD5WLR6_9PEZI|nr:hypothetical protein MKZ38_000058 [Zalerion maritima]
MKPSNSILFLLSIVSAASALAAPGSHSEEIKDLYKRKGGGGGGGRGGGSGGSRGGSSGSSSSGSSKGSGSTSSGSSSSNSGSSGGSKSGSSSSSSSGKGLGSSTSNTGGRTTTGSGVTPRFGGGKYYGGGATVPYRSGKKSPAGILPLAIIGGGLLFWSAAWYAGSYMYAFDNRYTFYNETADPERNETLPVYCICQPYSECGCNGTSDYVWLDDIIGNGDQALLNDTLVFVGEVNGTKGIYVNGTLPNGTTAAGGDVDPNAAFRLTGMISYVGFWPVALAAGAAVLL